MTGWKYAASALDDIKKQQPNFSSVECLIKVAAINGLYSTNLYDVGLMARRITDLRKETDFSKSIDTQSSRNELINRISRLEYPGGKTKWHVSFGSKFCHFFISDKFPILDKYAIRALQQHDESFRDGSKDQRYLAFTCSVEKVRGQFSVRDLDRYLWLKGMLLALDSNPDAQLSREFKDAAKAPSNKKDIEDLRSAT